MSTNDEQMAALEAARTNEDTVTAWVSIDIASTLSLSRNEQERLFKSAGNMIRQSLVEEIAKHRKVRQAEPAIADRPV